MRADRLVALLLLLQSRGTITAAQAARELEISERTARRDLEALSAAGVPVYSSRGRGGGWQLLGGARTNLTGLFSAEARALVTMAAASGTDDPALRTAIPKLLQALPEPLRAEARQVMGTIVADTSPWGSSGSARSPVEWLETIQKAIAQRRRIVLAYDSPRSRLTRRTIEPLGLVVKRGVWYVLGNTDKGRRTFRVDRILDIDLTNDPFDTPADFDLAAAWEEITSSYATRAKGLCLRARVQRWVLQPLAMMGIGVEVRADPLNGNTSADPMDVLEVELIGWKSRQLANQLAGLIKYIELIDPPSELTEELASIGAELCTRYGPEAIAKRGGSQISGTDVRSAASDHH